MRCRVRRRRNVVVLASGSVLLIVIVCATYVPVYVQVAALAQSLNLTTSSDVQTGFEHKTTELFGKCFVTCLILGLVFILSSISIRCSSLLLILPSLIVLVSAVGVVLVYTYYTVIQKKRVPP